jgi:hypothetical protein
LPPQHSHTSIQTGPGAAVTARGPAQEEAPPCTISLDLTPAEETRDDAAVLQLLLHSELNTPLSEHELVLEIGDRIAVADSLARLRGAGLIHRCGEFVFSIAAARRFAALA